MTPSPFSEKRLVRRIALVAGLPLLVTLAAGWLAVRTLTSDPRPYFAERYEPLAVVQSDDGKLENGYLLRDVRFTTSGGLDVDITVKRPASNADSLVPRPVVLLLGGHRTGRDAARLIEDTRGMTVVAMSYPFHGNERAKGFAVVKEVANARAAVLDTPPAVRVTLDWISSQPWADTDRLEIVGVSFGAAFAVIAGALDDRISRVWAIHGAGNPYLLLRTNLEPYVPTGVLQGVVAGLANVAINGPQLAPERWTAELAPRPLIMVNATGDSRMPREAVMTLYESAVGPRELVWHAGDHVSTSKRELIRALVDTVFERMK